MILLSHDPELQKEADCIIPETSERFS